MTKRRGRLGLTGAIATLALGWTFLFGIEGGRPAGGTQEPPLILYELTGPDRQGARAAGILHLSGPGTRFVSDRHPGFEEGDMVVLPLSPNTRDTGG